MQKNGSQPPQTPPKQTNNFFFNQSRPNSVCYLISTSTRRFRHNSIKNKNNPIGCGTAPGNLVYIFLLPNISFLGPPKKVKNNGEEREKKKYESQCWPALYANATTSGACQQPGPIFYWMLSFSWPEFQRKATQPNLTECRVITAIGFSHGAQVPSASLGRTDYKIEKLSNDPSFAIKVNF